MKKKILYLSQLYPYPPYSGGRIKTLNTLLALVKNYDIWAIFISEEAPRKKEIKKLAELGIKIKVFYSDIILASVKDDLLGLFKKFLRGIPHYVFQYTHGPAFAYIAKTIKKYRPDIIHVDHLNMAQYLPKQKDKNQKWILEHHNVETYVYWTRFIHTSKPTRKLYLLIETFLTFIYEFRTLRKFDHIFAISFPEKRRLEKIFFVNNVSVQPLVYPPSPVKLIPHNNPRIIFVGTLGWPPNEDAIEWFLGKIFPKILTELPSAEFHIVGRPGPRYRPVAKGNVILHGFKQNIRLHLTKANVFVAPFRMGGGLRLKCLTALASGIPLVSTSLGVEGIGIRHHKECLIADNARAFAQQTIKLLSSPKLRKSLRDNALKYIEKKHSSNKNEEFLKRYSKIV